MEPFTSRRFLVEVAKANQYSENTLEPELTHSQIWDSNLPGQAIADIVLAHIFEIVRNAPNQVLAARALARWLSRAVPLSLITIASDALKMQDESMYGPRRQPKLRFVSSSSTSFLLLNFRTTHCHRKPEHRQDQDLEPFALVAMPPQQ